MVFVNTKAFVERVARALERAGYRVGVLSGDVPQKKRESLLKKFQAGQLEILVATDVAARGLHIDGVSHVYNYDLPFDAEDYVHRIGRTARLGAEGDAISFACERYAQGLPDIEAYIEQKIPVEPITAELLVAHPRKPREGVEIDAAEGESVGEIFREAREQRAAEDQRRGVKPGAGRGRSDAGHGGRSERGPRPPRKPAAPRPAQEVAKPAAAAPTAAVEGASDPTRKRRRRRGGKRVDGAEGASMHAPGASKPTAPAQVVATRVQSNAESTGPSLLSRIKRRLESIVTRGPRSQH
jgi:ATP-dependent RNA helicase RhlB